MAALILVKENKYANIYTRLSLRRLLKLGIDEIVADYVKLRVKLESEEFKVEPEE